MVYGPASVVIAAHHALGALVQHAVEGARADGAHLAHAVRQGQATRSRRGFTAGIFQAVSGDYDKISEAVTNINQYQSLFTLL